MDAICMVKGVLIVWGMYCLSSDMLRYKIKPPSPSKNNKATLTLLIETA